MEIFMKLVFTFTLWAVTNKDKHITYIKDTLLTHLSNIILFCTCFN